MSSMKEENENGYHARIPNVRKYKFNHPLTQRPCHPSLKCQNQKRQRGRMPGRRRRLRRHFIRMVSTQNNKNLLTSPSSPFFFSSLLFIYLYILCIFHYTFPHFHPSPKKKREMKTIIYFILNHYGR